MPGVPKSRDEWLWGIAPVVQAVECRDRENQCVPFQTWEKAKKTNLAKSQCFCFVSTSGLVLAQGCWTTVKRLSVARPHRFLLDGPQRPVHLGVNLWQWAIAKSV